MNATDKQIEKAKKILGFVPTKKLERTPIYKSIGNVVYRYRLNHQFRDSGQQVTLPAGYLPTRFVCVDSTTAQTASEKLCRMAYARSN